MEVHYINAGRVDSILIQCDDEYLFIDGGFYWDGVTACNYIDSLGIKKIKYYIGSHGHYNHIGPAGEIMYKYNIDTAYVSKSKTSNYAYKAMLNLAGDSEKKYKVTDSKYVNALKKAKIIEWTYNSANNKITLGSATIECIGPLSYVYSSNSTENSNSMILRLEYGENSFLFTGDTGATQLKAVNTNRPGILNVDVYKNAHHNSSLPEATLKLINPKYVVFTTGSNYLPSSSYTNLLKKYSIKYYIAASNRDKTIKITSDGKNLSVKTGL